MIWMSVAINGRSHGKIRTITGSMVNQESQWGSVDVDEGEKGLGESLGAF